MVTADQLARLRGLGVYPIASGVFQLTFGPPGSPWPNSFWVQSAAGGVLVDAGTTLCARRILKQLHGLHDVLRCGRGPVLAGHALTHVHPDHSGASKAVCSALRVPFWVGEGDADVAEGSRPMVTWFQCLLRSFISEFLTVFPMAFPT